MKRLICTIITPDYIDRALAVLMSLRRCGADMPMVALTTEPVSVSVPGIRTIDVATLAKTEPLAKRIYEKYGAEKDALRWSLKPVLLSYLIRHSPEYAVIYADSDMAFFSPPDALLAYLGDAGGVVLTPHWRPLSPDPDRNTFRLNFMDGLYNAGCVSANINGINALNWWASACLSDCVKDYQRGLYVDQKYLDLMPVYFPEAIICRNPGFNVAAWNIHLRRIRPDGTRLVPDQWPVGLIHFTKSTINSIQEGRDPTLQPFLDRYQEILESAANAISAISLEKSLNIP